jgi:hypothetical protein
MKTIMKHKGKVHVEEYVDKPIKKKNVQGKGKPKDGAMDENGLQ